VSQFGDGDTVTVWRDSWHRARKEHKCRACHEPIAVGHRYHLTFYIFEGDAHTVKRCERCQTIFEHLSGRISAEGDSEEFCDEELNCGHTYRERWEEEAPPWLAALAFWRPGDPLPEPPKVA